MRAHLLAVGLTLASCGHRPAAPTTELLRHVSDVRLPGGANRFDYQDIDAATGLLVVAHMNDNSVLVLSLADGSVKKELTGIDTPRGVVIAVEVQRIFVTCMPNQLVIIDSSTLAEVSRVTTGASPDGVAWDPDDQIVGVSDQGDGAISLLAMAGTGVRTQVSLGAETGNVVYDARRKHFWITTAASELVEVDPKSATVTTRIALPGCSGAHGLRLHPDGRSAFVACEDGDQLARVELDATHAIATAASGADPDVLSIDAARGWLYLAAESGDVTVWDIAQPGLSLVGHAHPGVGAHTVVVDPATHRTFFPLASGPVLRIMRPAS
ncbi:MAG TPA: hypothetical protein VMZ53_33310 [Kofleriaceae bacterium]|nr:hypothetical protein [Kofleriaceae bacterium]